MAHLILSEITLQVSLISFVVNIIGAIIVEVVVEIKAVVASDAVLDTYACAVASYVVINRVRIALIVINNGGCVKSIV
jgi:hypothetical protein